MQIDFVTQPAAERGVFFQQAALKREMPLVIMEKDFWVCWMLRVLFGQPELASQMVFKGGTSLSKVFGVIERFSEDLDLSIAPAFVGFEEHDIAAAGSRTRRDALMKRLEQACTDIVRNRVQPAIEAVLVSALGPRPGGSPWLECETDAGSHSPVLLFHYPSSETAGFGYLRRTVKMEFGSLTDQRPTASHPVRPWVAEAFPDAFADWKCEVVALELERTFWEKATILHAEYHRAAADPMPDRFSRHYSDLAVLATHPVAGKAVAHRDLRERVVDWKHRFFARTWARYDLARPGTFRLVPSPARVSELHADYNAMRDMFIRPPPPFNEVVATLADLERRINEEAPR